MRTDLLAKYINRHDNVKEVFSMTYVLTSMMHPYVITANKAHLFINIRDSKGNLLAKHTWLNDNRTIHKLDLQSGDRIQGQFWTEAYWFGNNYHQNNVRRASNKEVFRFLYPQNVEKIGKDSIPKQQILNLENLTLYEDLDKLFGADASFEKYWLGLIHILDNCYEWNLTKVNKQYPHEYVLLSKWKQLTEEQRTKILNCRKYSHTQIKDYEELMKEL